MVVHSFNPSSIILCYVSLGVRDLIKLSIFPLKLITKINELNMEHLHETKILANNILIHKIILIYID